MEKTTKKVTLIKVALSLLSLVEVLAGQIVSQLIGSGLLAAGIPADLCNLTAAVCYALIVLAGLWLLCNKLLGLTLSDCRITAPHFHALWVVVAFALPGFVCIALINLPGYWQLFQLNDQTLGAVLSAAVFYLGLAVGFVEEAVFRGVFLSVLERRFHRWVGIMLPSVLFAALHLIGAQLDLAGAVQLLVSGSLVGILFSLVAVETGSIWCSALMHAVWNMVMVGGILHIGPSAQADAVANYVLTGSSTLLTGGSFGVETSVIAMAAYAVFAGLAFWRCRRKGLL